MGFETSWTTSPQFLILSAAYLFSEAIEVYGIDKIMHQLQCPSGNGDGGEIQSVAP